MEVGTLNAQLRSQFGTGESRKFRRAGTIPAVCYGAGQDPIQIHLNPSELAKSLDPKKGRNTVLRLNIPGRDAVTVMLKDTQRDPQRGTLLHADFLRVALDKPVRAVVPLNLVGKSQGVKDGGSMHQVYHSIELFSLPERIPTELELDVTALVIGQSFHVSDLKLPEGVRPAIQPSVTLCVVTAQKDEKAAEAVVGDAAAADAAADPKAAGKAPAAGDKAAAGKAGGDKAAAGKAGGDKAAAKPAAGGKK